MNTEVTKREIPNLCGRLRAIPRIDETLTKKGMGADAKAVGDRLKEATKAVNFSYNGNGNGLNATTVQEALDELNENINTVAADVGIITYYRTLNSIGLKDDNTTYTIEQVCEAVPNWSTLILGTSKAKITDLPISYGILEIVRGDSNYCAVRFTNSSSVSTNLYAYMGRYAPNQSNRWSGWFQINFTKVE